MKPGDDVTCDWRSPAALWARRELGVPDDRLLRIADVRQVSPTEAWVALEVDGRQVVVGLRREPCASGGDDHWVSLLYLHEADTPAPVTSAGRETAGSGARPTADVAPGAQPTADACAGRRDRDGVALAGGITPDRET